MNWEERVLLGTILVTAGAMLAGATQYQPAARVFPQVMAAITLFFGVATIVQDRIGLGTGDSSGLVDRVQDRADLEEEVADTGDEGGVKIGKADPGEFRIDQPTTAYTVPFADREVSQRTAVALLLLVYLGAVWLLGIFLSSVLFVLLYGRVADLRRTVFLGLLAFTVLALFMFGMWLETPLFRPAHDLFVLPGVGR